MIEIIAPKQFNVISWKNGKGETTELAINNNGCLDKFDWRLSIASVANDGFFSDFTGYQRNLVLIAGEGIMLQHDNNSTDNLTNLLDIATFNGACSTYGKLSNGAIKDFNIITNQKKIQSIVHCYLEEQKIEIQLTESSIYFAYSLTDKIKIEVNVHEKTIVPQGHLVKISFVDTLNQKADSTINISSENMILIELKPKDLSLHE